MRVVNSLAVLLLIITAVTGAHAQSTFTDDRALAAFTQATQDYARLHRQLERSVAPLDINSAPAVIAKSVQALAQAIRAERPDARQGDLFTPEVARQLRTRIDIALLQHGFTANDIRMSERADGVDPATVILHVNDAFPWTLGVAMFPCVIDALPPLPPELQYHIVGDALLLIDVHAGLIVDILPEAISDLGSGGFRIWDLVDFGLFGDR